MNEVNARRARLLLGWVTVFGRVFHLGMSVAVWQLCELLYTRYLLTYLLTVVVSSEHTTQLLLLFLVRSLLFLFTVFCYIV